MERNEQLRQIVAQISGADPAEIGPQFSLRSRGLQASVRRAALASAIRRLLGAACPEAYTAASFGELEAAVFGNGSRPAPSAAPPAAPSESLLPPGLNGEGALACGIDIEMVDALPAAEDYWEHEFYREMFAPDEIAYCALQENPRMHFAARWCAKEALIKCDPAFLGHKLADIEIIRSPSGRISLAHRVNGESHGIPLAVSISHTETMATAMVFGRRNGS